MKFVPLNEHRLQAKPTDEIEWLMQPFDSPDSDDNHNLVVEAALDSMPERMREILHAIFYEQIPYSELGERLGCSKPQAWRLTKAALAHLATIIQHNPTLNERYDMYTCWEDAAAAVVESYDRVLPRAALIDVIDWCGNELARCMRDHKNLESFMFNSIAMEAVAELKDRGRWNMNDFLMLLCSKQADYGHQNILAFGLEGVAVRMHDKIARLKNLNGRQALNEPLLDTWYDLIGYATIAEMLYQNTFTLNLKDTTTDEPAA